MNTLTKALRKALLWLITAVIPVVVAACYGVMYAFSKSGRVVDKDTKEGIDGIKVSCVVNDRSDVEDVSYTYGGEFILGFDRECTMVIFTDVDGEDNGGYYKEEIIPYDELGDYPTVEMEKQE